VDSWTDCEFAGRDFRDFNNATRLDDADLRGATIDPSLWTTADGGLDT
jgi:hypothetical protein